MRKLKDKHDEDNKKKRPQMAGERLMTANELAEYLRLPKRRIYYWANQGVLPHARIGRSIRFHPERVRKVLGLD